MAQGSGDGALGGYQALGAMTALGATVGADGAREWRFSAADGAEARVALLASDIARVRLLPPGSAPTASWAVARETWPSLDIAESPAETPEILRLTTDALSIEITTQPWRLTCRWPDGVAFAEDDPARGMGSVDAPGAAGLPDALAPVGSLRCHKRLASGERVIGAGERAEPLDKHGHRLTFWNTDPPVPHTPETGAMYATLPFWTLLRPDGRAWGVFMESPALGDLDAGASDSALLSFGVAEGELTYYIFAGPTPADVQRQYSELTGHMPLPPRWALGYGQSRWSYHPDAWVREIAEGFRSRQIPCDHLWLDIDYMDGYRVFTWHPTRFPQPAALLADLRAQGFKAVAIIDPGVKADPTDETFADGVARDYFVRQPDGSLFTGNVWPGASVFADFSRADVRAWWGERHRPLLDAGLAGIWDDMNEPSLTNFFVPGSGSTQQTTIAPDAIHRPDGPDGPPLPHARFHNAYGMQMARATREALERMRPNERAFVLSRSGYAGIQRYAANWTGDNSSRWEHLTLSTRICLSVSMSGQPFVGFDSGGFTDGPSGEMLTRYLQLGAFFPFYRNHSMAQTPLQEPWEFGQPWEAFCRDAINLRYQLLPYLYTLVEEASRTGAPITRPMLYDFPDDAAVAGLEDQFMFGGDFLVTPVLIGGQWQRDVRFPAGVWRDWRTGQRYSGPLSAQIETPLDAAPLFLRESAIIPLGPTMPYVGALAEEPLTLVCALGPEDSAQATGTLYEDDGATRDHERGVWSRTHFTAARSGQRVTIRAATPDGLYRAMHGGVTVELRLPLTEPAPRATRPQVRAATVNGQPLEGTQVERVERRYEICLRAHLGDVTAPFTVEFELA